MTETDPITKSESGAAWQPPKARGFGVLAAGILPATSARRTERMPLWHAYIVHLVATVVAVIALADAALIAGVLGQIIGELIDEAQRHPWRVALSVPGAVLLFELAHAVLAFFLIAWGAQNEPLRDSYRHALRQVWVHATHVFLAVLVVLVVTVPLVQAERRWDAAYDVPPPEWPQPPANAQPDSQAAVDYQVALQEHWFAWRAWSAERQDAQPWYIRYTGQLIVPTGFVVAMWLLWALLRSVGTTRRTAAVERPPLCEACGYNLTTIPMESRCPECAEPVIASLGPDARPGPSWQRRREAGRLFAWWTCFSGPILRPKYFGRQCRLVTPLADHRGFLAMHLPVIFLIAGSALLGLFAIEMGQSPFADKPGLAYLTASVFGCVSALGALGLTLAVAAVLGLSYSVYEKRNLLPGSVQIASYLIGFLTLWALFGAVTGLAVAAMANTDGFQENMDDIGVYYQTAAAFIWLVPNALCGAWYVILISRGIVGARYANR